MGIRSANRYGEKDFGACGLVGIIDKKGRRISGSIVVDSLCNMEERGNGLGSGYAIYGAYPDFSDAYAFHLMYQNQKSKEEVEEILAKEFNILHSEPIPTSVVKTIKNPPSFWRYFLKLKENVREKFSGEEDYIVKVVMKINDNIEGAFVISSGKNMAVFKGVGYPDEIAEFFRIQDYSGYILIGHTRFPTNTPGWWGGAHPFTLLDWAIVHNGEISSYGTNRRFVEMFGYKCTMLTDTEVIAYLIDFLVRKRGFSLETAAKILAPPFWKDIDSMSEKDKTYYTALRMTYGSAILNGPFAIIAGFSDGIMGLNDRIKLRPLVVGKKDDLSVIASEEAAIRVVLPAPHEVWAPPAGEPVIEKLIKEKS
jgi:glutamate synthase domain-containing protein 1